MLHLARSRPWTVAYCTVWFLLVFIAAVLL